MKKETKKTSEAPKEEAKYQYVVTAIEKDDDASVKVKTYTYDEALKYAADMDKDGKHENINVWTMHGYAVACFHDILLAHMDDPEYDDISAIEYVNMISIDKEMGYASEFITRDDIIDAYAFVNNELYYKDDADGEQDEQTYEREGVEMTIKGRAKDVHELLSELLCCKKDDKYGREA